MTYISVLFVCLGNICRSPAGEAILKYKLRNFPQLDQLVHVESCGTGGWHIGELPDSRMRAAAAKRHIPMTSSAQQFKSIFFDQFDYILAADHSVLETLQSYTSKKEYLDKIQLINRFNPNLEYYMQEVPDPYYGGDEGFDHVLDMLDSACDGLIKELSTKALELNLPLLKFSV
ncbi:MAG: wzb [Chlamydiales bacterium]|jgi:protein-tyrosine phosphatase|nr:wzb [Chlamydiales bacterium]